MVKEKKHGMLRKMASGEVLTALSPAHRSYLAQMILEFDGQDNRIKNLSLLCARFKTKAQSMIQLYGDAQHLMEQGSILRGADSQEESGKETK